MERLVKILDTMELLESYFESRLAEGNEISIAESSCAAGAEYRELAAEAEAIMAALAPAEESEVVETEETAESFLNSVFGIAKNDEIDALIESAVLSNKRLDEMTTAEYNAYNLNIAREALRRNEARIAAGNKTAMVRNLVKKYRKKVEILEKNF